MKKYCESCHHKIKGNDFIDISKLGNPLLNGYWCSSCFLLTLYKILDGIRIDVSELSSRITLDKHE